MGLSQKLIDLMGTSPVQEIQKTSFDINSDMLSPALKEAMGFKLAQNEATRPQNAHPDDIKWLREDMGYTIKEKPATTTEEKLPGFIDPVKEKAYLEKRKQDSPQRRSTDTPSPKPTGPVTPKETPEERAIRMMKVITG